MARGGRSWNAAKHPRDKLGRFAPKGGGALTGGTLKARTSLRDTRRRLGSLDPADDRYVTSLRRPRLKGAETRGKKRLVQSKRENRRALQTRLDDARKGVFKPGAAKKAKKVGIAEVAKGKRAKSSASGDRRQVVQSINGKKVVVELKRAKPGGEYGPDGHFYPGGAWMSIGKYQGGTKAALAAGIGSASAKRQDGTGGRDSSSRVVRQREPKPPPVAPIKGKGLATPKGLKKRAQKLDDSFFDDRGFVSDRIAKASGYTSAIGGTDFTAALANRLSVRDANRKIARLRQRATNKDDFDYYVFKEGRDWIGQDAERYRRSGMLSNSSRLGYIKAHQLVKAVGEVAGARSMRRPKDRRRRDGSAEALWTLNGTLMTSRR